MIRKKCAFRIEADIRARTLRTLAHKLFNNYDVAACFFSLSKWGRIPSM